MSVAVVDKVAERYTAWLRDNGFHLHADVCIRSLDGRGRGLVATADLPEDTTLFRIPPHCVLRAHTSLAPLLSSLDTEDRDAAIESLISPGSWSGAVIALMHELSLGPASFWAPYLATLPRLQDMGHPVLWTASQRAWLASTTLSDMSGDVDDLWDATVCPWLEQFAPALMDKQAFLRCLLIVSSYSFTDPDTGEVMLLPPADMLNHHTGGNNARVFADEQPVRMATITDVGAGAELLNTYGDLCNAALLQRYGYVCEDRRDNDYAELPVVTAWDSITDAVKPVDATERVVLLQQAGIYPEDAVADEDGSDDDDDAGQAEYAVITVPIHSACPVLLDFLVSAAVWPLDTLKLVVGDLARADAGSMKQRAVTGKHDGSDDDGDGSGSGDDGEEQGDDGNESDESDDDDERFADLRAAIDAHAQLVDPAERQRVLLHVLNKRLAEYADLDSIDHASPQGKAALVIVLSEQDILRCALSPMPDSDDDDVPDTLPAPGKRRAAAGVSEAAEKAQKKARTA